MPQINSECEICHSFIWWKWHDFGGHSHLSLCPSQASLHGAISAGSVGVCKRRSNLYRRVFEQFDKDRDGLLSLEVNPNEMAPCNVAPPPQRMVWEEPSPAGAYPAETIDWLVYGWNVRILIRLKCIILLQNTMCKTAAVDKSISNHNLQTTYNGLSLCIAGNGTWHMRPVHGQCHRKAAPAAGGIDWRRWKITLWLCVILRNMCPAWKIISLRVNVSQSYDWHITNCQMTK